jgi:hypothetical protein
MAGRQGRGDLLASDIEHREHRGDTARRVEEDAMTVPPGLFARLKLAIRVLVEPEVASRMQRALVDDPLGLEQRERALPPRTEPGATEPELAAPPTTTSPAVQPSVAPVAAPTLPPTPARADSTPGALHLLSILQREGRFVDFVIEEVAPFTDAEVGAAARVVHEGCRKALLDAFTFAPVRSEGEGAPVVLETGFDAASVRLTGKVAGEPPFRGTLAHAGWRVVDIKLPSRAATDDGKVIAPAEVEVA